MTFGTCLKYLIFLINLLFGILGLGIVSYGTYFYIKRESTVTDYMYISIIVVGCITFLIAFCGCCGSCTENHCLLVTYSAAMFLLLVIKVVAVVIIFVKKNEWSLDILMSSPNRCCTNTSRFSCSSECIKIIENTFQTVGFILAGIAGYELIAVVVGLYVANYVRKDRRRRQQHY